MDIEREGENKMEELLFGSVLFKYKLLSVCVFHLHVNVLTIACDSIPCWLACVRELTIASLLDSQLMLVSLPVNQMAHERTDSHGVDAKVVV